MSLPYHDGEFEVQARTGEFDRAVQVAGAIRGAVPPPVVRFLAEQSWLLAGARDESGAVWATALAGPVGFLGVPDPVTLRVAVTADRTDPLHRLSTAPAAVGLLVIDLATRRRARLNGRSRPTADGLLVALEHVYPNCMKYISRRDIRSAAAAPAVVPGDAAQYGVRLTPEQQRRLAECDTFFLASAHPDGPADVSHRGGAPGFLQVLSPTRLRWPDYVGNGMFNTLGNLHLDPRAGLVVVDFATGTLLHLTGQAEVDYETPAAREFPGAQRLVTFDIERVIERPAALPVHFGPPEASPFSPPSRYATGSEDGAAPG